LAGSRFIQNVRHKAGYQIGVSHGVWALDKNGFNFLNIKQKGAFKGAFSIIHQLNLNDIMLEFFKNGQNEGILWNPDGSYRYQSTLGNFEPDAVIFNPSNQTRVLFEYDNSTKYRGPLVENLSKYIVWNCENSKKKAFLHYSVNDLKRANFIQDSFHIAFEKQKDLYHLVKDDLISLTISLKNETHIHLSNLLFDKTEKIEVVQKEEPKGKPLLNSKAKRHTSGVANLPSWFQVRS
jgi:hypothetical protein